MTPKKGKKSFMTPKKAKINSMTPKKVEKKFWPKNLAFSFWVFLAQNISLCGKCWIKTHNISYFWLISIKNPDLTMSYFWDMGVSWKEGAYIFCLFPHFGQFILNIDEKQVQIPQKSVFSLANRVQNNFSPICSSWDMKTILLADHVTFLNCL